MTIVVALSGSSDFAYVPSYSSSVAHQPRARVSQFGDGYEQRVADGINTDLVTWNLSFTNIDSTSADAIEALLSGWGAVTPFTWTPPGKSQIICVCSQFSRSYPTANTNTITATFRQVLG